MLCIKLKFLITEINVVSVRYKEPESLLICRVLRQRPGIDCRNETFQFQCLQICICRRWFCLVFNWVGRHWERMGKSLTVCYQRNCTSCFEGMWVESQICLWVYTSSSMGMSRHCILLLVINCLHVIITLSWYHARLNS